MTLVRKSYRIEHYLIKDDGRFPNNEHLPVLVYRSILNISPIISSFHIKKMLEENGWGNTWKGGIYSYHHYHSNTAEVLAIYKGKTILLLGGVNGIVLTVEEGDVIIVPPGVAHKNLGQENEIMCVAGYPGGKQYDMKYGIEGERPDADKNIQQVPIPSTDPVLNDTGALKKYWKDFLMV